MTPTKPKIYLAGKVGKNGWRHLIVPKLTWHGSSNSYIKTEDFIYTGPFFQSCDHGCFHGNTTHGAMLPLQKNRTIAQSKTFNNCLTGIKDADLVIIYINAFDIFGTLIEAGWVQALKKPHVVIFGTDIASEINNEFWFATMGQPLDVFYGVGEAEIRNKVLTIIDDYRLQNSCGE